MCQYYHTIHLALVESRYILRKPIVLIIIKTIPIALRCIRVVGWARILGDNEGVIDHYVVLTTDIERVVFRSQVAMVVCAREIDSLVVEYLALWSVVVIVVADSTKLGKISVYRQCSLDEVDAVVCDEDISKIYSEKFSDTEFIFAK